MALHSRVSSLGPHVRETALFRAPDRFETSPTPSDDPDAKPDARSARRLTTARSARQIWVWSFQRRPAVTPRARSEIFERIGAVGPVGVGWHVRPTLQPPRRLATVSSAVEI